MDTSSKRASLTQESLQGLLEGLRGSRPDDDRVRALKHDWRQFLEENFEVSAEQREALGRISKKDLGIVQVGLRHALDYDGAITATFGRRKMPGEIVVESGPRDGLERALGDLVILRCSWDDDCNGGCEWFPDF